MCRSLALVVDVDAELRRSIARAASSWMWVGARRTLITIGSIDVASTVEEGLLALHARPNIVVCEVRLGSENAMGIVCAAARMRRAPPVIAMSEDAAPEEAFALSRKGAGSFVTKPFEMSELRQTMQAVLRFPSLD